MPPPRPPYRLFHLSAHLRLFHLSARPRLPADDYYALLLSTPHPSPTPTKGTKTPNPTPPAKLPPQSPNQGPNHRISFRKALSGPSPSARAQGMGLERPREPDNCCMSGCVHCVWDAWRVEVEGWAEGRGGGVEGEEGGNGGEGLFEGVEVGIRAFMEMEKRLREGRGEG